LQRQLDGEEIIVLLKRGKDLISTGDLTAARLVLRKAADANNAEAALALGATYDPFVLRELKVYNAGCCHGARLVRESDRAWFTSGATAARDVNSRHRDALKRQPRHLTVGDCTDVP
jgi:TPR repeat protein